jgi:hypothetical protein
MLGVLQCHLPAKAASVSSRALPLSLSPRFPQFVLLLGVALVTHVDTIVDTMPNQCPPLDCVNGLHSRELEANNDISGTGVSPPALYHFVSAILAKF